MTAHLKVLDAESNENELVIEGYLALYGGDDLTGERFQKSTLFDSDYTELNMVAVDWEHGLKVDGDDAPGKNDVLGRVDWASAKSDDTGLLVRRILNRRNRYVKEIVEPLARAGLLGSSSEAVPEKVQKSDDGTIEIWPIKRDSFTVTPAEPRLLTEHQARVIKSLVNDYPALKSLLISEDAKDSIESDKGIQGNETKTQEIKEGLTMSDNQTQDNQQAPVDVAAIAKAAAEEAVKAYREKLEAEEKPLPRKGLTVVADSADRALEGNPFKTAGEFYMQVKAASQGRGYDERLNPLKSEVVDEGIMFSLPTVAQKGIEANIKAPTGLGELVPENGGFLVGTDRQDGVSMLDYASGVLWPRAMDIGIGPNSNGLTMNALNETSRAAGSRWGGVLGYWLAEAGEITATKPTFRQIEAKLKKVGALVYATEELMLDSTALASVINRVVPAELMFQKDDAAMNGSGVGKPLGVLNSPALVEVAKEVGQAANTIVAQNIINMWARRWARGNYVWFINQDVEPQLHQLNLPVGTGGALVYMPPGGLSASPYGSLYGRPVITTEFNPTLGTVGDILLADMSQYLTISKGGVRSAESIHVRFVYDESVFRFVERVDGLPIWHSPITPFKGTATQSPFVALATRS